MQGRKAEGQGRDSVTLARSRPVLAVCGACAQKGPWEEGKARPTARVTGNTWVGPSTLSPWPWQHYLSHLNPHCLHQHRLWSSGSQGQICLPQGSLPSSATAEREKASQWAPLAPRRPAEGAPKARPRHITLVPPGCSRGVSCSAFSALHLTGEPSSALPPAQEEREMGYGH